MSAWPGEDRRPWDEIRLTVTQFRLLQRVSDGGLNHQALRQSQGYGVGGQIRTLRHLGILGLVVEKQTTSGIRFEITDAGQSVVQAGA